jgi:hypothetical protein
LCLLSNLSFEAFALDLLFEHLNLIFVVGFDGINHQFILHLFLLKIFLKLFLLI